MKILCNWRQYNLVVRKWSHFFDLIKLNRALFYVKWYVKWAQINSKQIIFSEVTFLTHLSSEIPSILHCSSNIWHFELQLSSSVIYLLINNLLLAFFQFTFDILYTQSRKPEHCIYSIYYPDLIRIFINYVHVKKKHKFTLKSTVFIRH